MIDYIKGCITDMLSIHRLLMNEKLDFKTKFCERSGEIESYPKHAKYGEWEVVIHSPTLALVEGSLHKHFTGGRNHDDFCFRSLFSSIRSFSEIFSVSPLNVRIQNLEFGVNICPDINATEILHQVLSYKNRSEKKALDNPKAYFIEFEFVGYYYLKLYDKGKQYDTDNNILRLELKSVRSKFIAGTRVRYLSDLLDPSCLYALGKLLVRQVNEIAWDDPSIKSNLLNNDDRKTYELLKNPREWRKCKGAKTSTHRAREKRFKAIIEDKGSYKLNSLLNNLVRSKWDELMSMSEVVKEEISHFLTECRYDLSFFPSNIYAENRQTEEINRLVRIRPQV